MINLPCLEHYRNRLGAAVKAWREFKGFSTREFARLAEIKQPTLIQIEKGREPAKHNLALLAEIAAIETAALMRDHHCLIEDYQRFYPAVKSHIGAMKNAAKAAADCGNNLAAVEYHFTYLICIGLLIQTFGINLSYQRPVRSKPIKRGRIVQMSCEEFEEFKKDRIRRGLAK